MKKAHSTNLFEEEMDRHLEVAKKTRTELSHLFPKVIEVCASCLKKGGKIIFLGNGGSAADSQHLATELCVRYKTDGPAIAALALTTDTSAITAIGNDLGFEEIFSRQIEALCLPADVVVSFSTSGTSPNVIRAIETASKIGAKTISFGGKEGGMLPNISDLCLIVPAQETSSIQEMHITLGHILCDSLEKISRP